MSVAQIARTWWPATARSEENARRRLVQLDGAGFVHVFPLTVSPEIPVREPVLAWHPPLPTPDFGPVAYVLDTRRREPPQTVQAVIASDYGGRLMGGKGGRYPRPDEPTHDLHLAAVFLLKRNQNPRCVRYWVAEHRLAELRASRDERLPDAMIRHPRKVVIESGGRYNAPKLRSFHEWCAAKPLAYEIW
jgi:hypothetical protein